MQNVQDDDELTALIGLQEAGDLVAACSGYERILRLRPNDSRVLYLYSTALYQQGDHSGALQQVERALGLDEGDARCLNHRREVLAALGETERAVQSFDPAGDTGARQPLYALDKHKAQTRKSESEPLDSLAFLSTLAVDAPRHILIVGGLPRSGTSSCDRFLHAHSGCFMLDEHHGLLNDQLLSGHEYLVDYQNSEIDLWKSATGRGWRNYNSSELDRVRRRALLSLLFLYTRRDKFVDKSPREIAVVGIKLPHIEATVSRIAALAAPCPVTFVYCVREPTLVLSSNWEMPWVSTGDGQLFAQNMVQQYATSLAAFRALRQANIRTIIWRTPDTSGDEGSRYQAFLRELGLVQEMGCYQKTALAVVDEWPRTRRRRVAPLDDGIIRAFSAADAVQEFRREFGLPEPRLRIDSETSATGFR